MKRLPLVIIAVLVLALGVIGCTPAATPEPDIPRYTSDGVIAVAQAQYSGYSPSKGRTSAIVSVFYEGKGIWKVDVSAPIGYVLQGPGGLRYRETLYFNEATGSLEVPPSAFSQPSAIPSPTPTPLPQPAASFSSNLTDEEVIQLVKGDGLPRLGATATGEWHASVESEGKWIVRGKVNITYSGTYQTIWRYDGHKVELVALDR